MPRGIHSNTYQIASDRDDAAFAKYQDEQRTIQEACNHEFVMDSWGAGGPTEVIFYECVYCQHRLFGDIDKAKIPGLVPAELELPL